MPVIESDRIGSAAGRSLISSHGSPGSSLRPAASARHSASAAQPRLNPALHRRQRAFRPYSQLHSVRPRSPGPTVQGPSALSPWHSCGVRGAFRGSVPRKFPHQFPRAPPPESWCPNHAAVRSIDPKQHQGPGGPTRHGGQGQHQQSHERAAVPTRHPRRTQRTRPHQPPSPEPLPPSARTSPRPRPCGQRYPAVRKDCRSHSQGPQHRTLALVLAAAATPPMPVGWQGQLIHGLAQRRTLQPGRSSTRALHQSCGPVWHIPRSLRRTILTPRVTPAIFKA